MIALSVLNSDSIEAAEYLELSSSDSRSCFKILNGFLEPACHASNERRDIISGSLLLDISEYKDTLFSLDVP